MRSDELPVAFRSREIKKLKGIHPIFFGSPLKSQPIRPEPVLYVAVSLKFAGNFVKICLLYIDISGKKGVRIEVYNLTSRHFRGILGDNLRLRMTFNC